MSSNKDPTRKAVPLMDAQQLAQIQALADELCIEQSPNWKDDWERGHDAGTLDAGRKLSRLLESFSNTGSAGRATEEKPPPVILLDTLLQDQFWYDRAGTRLQLVDLTTSHVRATHALLIRASSNFFAMAQQAVWGQPNSTLSLEAEEKYGTARFTDAQEWIESTPLVRKLQSLIDKADEFRDRHS